MSYSVPHNSTSN